MRADLKVRVSYPNLALRADDRTVVIHHGHFTERIYYHISQMRNLIFWGRTANAERDRIRKLRLDRLLLVHARTLGSGR